LFYCLLVFTQTIGLVAKPTSTEKIGKAVLRLFVGNGKNFVSIFCLVCSTKFFSQITIKNYEWFELQLNVKCQWSHLQRVSCCTTKEIFCAPKKKFHFLLLLGVRFRRNSVNSTVMGGLARRVGGAYVLKVLKPIIDGIVNGIGSFHFSWLPLFLLTH
jgi:hypothetical protein